MKIHEIEQRTPEWYDLRAGMPTASEFGKIITAKTRKPSSQAVGYAYRLAAELYAGPDVGAWGGNNDMDRGKWLEDEARSDYAFVHNVNPREVGFITDDAKTYGCSPDSLIGDDGMLEIKCLNPERHVAAFIDIHNGVVPADYVMQVQGQLMVAERKWCDLLFHHAKLPQATIRVEPDPELHDALREGIAEVIKKRDVALGILNA